MDEKKQKTVFILHTSFALVEVLQKLTKEYLPDVRVVNLVDDSLLADARMAGHMIPSVARRLTGYAILAQSAGADAIFNSCSSVGEVADLIRQVVDIPVVKIDDCMAAEAVRTGTKVAVVATVPTTLDPTARLIQHKAQEMGKPIQIQRHLVEGAFDTLMAGNAAKHDELVSNEIRCAAQEADVVVLAQGSMARLIPNLTDLPVPVLASPLSGIEDLKRVLESK